MGGDERGFGDSGRFTKFADLGKDDLCFRSETVDRLLIDRRVVGGLGEFDSGFEFSESGFVLHCGFLLSVHDFRFSVRGDFDDRSTFGRQFGQDIGFEPSDHAAGAESVLEFVQIRRATKIPTPLAAVRAGVALSEREEIAVRVGVNGTEDRLDLDGTVHDGGAGEEQLACGFDRVEVRFLIAKHSLCPLRLRVLEKMRLVYDHQIPCARAEERGVLAKNIVIDDNDVIVCIRLVGFLGIDYLDSEIVDQPLLRFLLPVQAEGSGTDDEDFLSIGRGVDDAERLRPFFLAPSRPR